jgi:DNA-binding LytR/AlgR family response regulator
MGTESIRIMIVEDDLSFALELEMLLDDMGYILAGRADHAETALALILQEKPDLVLMDIEIRGGMDGTGIGQAIAPLGIPVLYISSQTDDHYRKAREQTGTIGYLVKPVDAITLRSAIEMAVLASNRRSGQEKSDDEVATLKGEYVFIRDRRRLVKIRINEIRWIRADGPYACLCTGDQQFLLSTHLGALEEKLQDHPFARVHRSWLIHCDHIDSIEEDVVRIGGERVPVGKSHREDFYRRIRQL